MGRDYSSKVRQQKQLERKQGRRASYDRILIVSEGSKTEPHYFTEIRAAYRLHTANVEVQPSELGTAPIQVVQYARELFEHGNRQKNIQPTSLEALLHDPAHADYLPAGPVMATVTIAAAWRLTPRNASRHQPVGKCRQPNAMAADTGFATFPIQSRYCPACDRD